MIINSLVAMSVIINMKNKDCIGDKKECTTVSSCNYCNLIIHLEFINQSIDHWGSEILDALKGVK
jgi:hypothetical protein